MTIKNKVKISNLEEVIEAISSLFNEYLTDEAYSCFEKAIEHISEMIEELEKDDAE